MSLTGTEIVDKETMLKKGYELFKKGMISDQQNDYPSALMHFKESLAIHEKVLGKKHIETARSYIDVGYIYEKMEDYPKALEYFQKALSIQENELGEKHTDTIMSYGNLSFIYQKMRNYSKALEYHLKIVNINEKVLGEAHPDTIRSYDRLNSLYQFMQDYSQALKYAKKVLMIRERVLGSEHIDIAKSYQDLSFLYLTIGEYQDALKYAQKSLVVNEKVLGKEHTDTITNYNNLGRLYLYVGDYQKALEYTQKALTVNQKVKGKDHADIASDYINMGAVYQWMGDYSKALEYFQKALIINEKIFGKQDATTAISYISLGTVFQFMGDYQKALKFHQKSLSVIEKFYGEEHTSTASGYMTLASLYQFMGDYSKSLEFYHKALSINEKVLGEEHVSTGSIYTGLGYLYGDIGDFSKAKNYHEKAMAITEKFLGKEHILTAVNYIALGSSYQKMEDYPLAYQYAKQGFNIFLKNRNRVFTLLDSTQKEKYLKSTSGYISSLLSSSYQYVQGLNEQNNAVKVQQILRSSANAWLNYKGSIFDSENAIAVLYGKTQDHTLKLKIDDLVMSKRVLAKLYQSLPNLTELEVWKTKIKTIEARISKLTTEISAEATSFKEQQGLKNIDYKDIASRLKESELYIDYARTGGYYYLFTLDKQENIEFIQIDKNSTKMIDSIVKSFRADLKTILDNTKISEQTLQTLTERSKEKLSELFRIVIQKPLGVTIKDKSSLIISPDGALRLLPFEALYDNEHSKYFIEAKEIRYTPSGKELVRLYRYSKDKVSKAKKSAVIFANPDFNIELASQNQEQIVITPNTNRSGIIKSLFRMRFDPLPGTEAEAKAVKATMKKEFVSEYQTNNATESTLMKVKEPKFLHIATHGFFINDNNIPNPMLKSGIALAGANTSAIQGKSDGIVTALKLSGLDLKRTDLVVLSACQTGVVDINSTDSVSGLSKAFIQAGTKNIVMSLWSVDDQATKELMASFYQEMKHSNNYAKALKAAKLKMISEGRHPFYWAAFVLSGL